MTTELRRSSRSRKPVLDDVAPKISIVDDEDEEHSSKRVNRGRRTDAKKRSLEHVDDSDDSEDEDDEEDDSEDDDPSFDGRTIKETKRKSPSSANSKSTLQSSKSPRRGVLKPTVTTTNKRNASAPSINAITPQNPRSSVHQKQRQPRGTTTATKGTLPKNSQNASLAVLVQKMALPNISDKDTTLFASTLRAIVATSNLKKNGRHPKKNLPISTTSSLSSQYTETVQNVVKTFLKNVQTELESGENHNMDETNVMLVHLYNMIFCSVGGTTILSPTEEQTLDDMTDEDWTNHIDVILEEMSNNTSTSGFVITTKLSPLASTPAQTDYLTIYSEFWYHLCTMILTSYNNNSEENDENGRFRVELIRQIVSRLIELVNVGVPDIRYAIGIAIYQMGEALLQYTTNLQHKVVPVERQYQVAQKNHHKKKASAMQNQIQLWKRTITDCEEIVKELIVTTVFTIRYKDHDPMIRKASLQALHQYCMIRSDIFLSSFYLKYFGWMMSDKHPIVRNAAILGLMKPMERNIKSTKTADGSKVDIASNMTSVITKFLPRIVDCVIDVDVTVQETAMDFVLLLLRHYDFFNDVDNERMWNQINVRALDPHTSQHVRTNALYFVLEQLDESSTTAVTPSTTGITNSSERDVVTQLYAIGKWIAHTLSDSTIPVSEIRYDLVDFIVMSLREMPEYKHHVSHHWNAMLRCVLHGDEHISRKNSGAKKSDNRINIVTQRVMIRMLVAAVQFEVMNIGQHSKGKDKVVPMNLIDDGDSEFLEAQRSALTTSFQSAAAASTTAKSATSKNVATSNNAKAQEDLTMALLRELPQLLVSFKSDTSIVKSLTTLPLYFLPSILNLPSRKKDVQALLSNLSTIYNDSTDSVVLTNCCQALVFCAKASQARSDMAVLAIQKLWDGTLSRLMHLIKKKSCSISSMEGTDSDDESNTTVVNQETSIQFCLLRLSILLKRWRCIGRTLDDSVSSSDEQLEDVASTVAGYLSSELQSRQCHADSFEGDDENAGDKVSERLKIWSSMDDSVHRVVSKSVSDGFDLLLGMTAWRLRDEVQRIDNGADVDATTTTNVDNHVVLRLRRLIETMIKTCYDQFLPPESMNDVSEAHQMFSTKVQEYALRVSCDIRTLFPRKWSVAKSLTLKAFAIEDDMFLVGGGYRFIRSQEWRLKLEETTLLSKQQKQDAVCNILLPIARALGTNWETGSRKEAGAALLHISGSGKEASELVQCMLRVLKKINPVRLLEAQMACLRQKFEEWAEDEPEEPGDRPTDAEMQEFEEKEELHREKFDLLITTAARFASSLGVGKIRDNVLNPALLGFVREGVRFAFSTDIKGSDEPLPLGCRLVFLSILTKYLMWIRPNKDYKSVVRDDINSYEAALRSHSEYSDVYEDDLKCLFDFRKAGELGDYIAATADGDIDTQETTKTAPSTYEPASARVRTSLGSSVSSIRSKVSGALDSINEQDPFDEDNDGDDTEGHDDTSHSTPSPPKRPRTVYSARTQSSVASTIGPVFQDDTDDSDTGGSSSF